MRPWVAILVLACLVLAGCSSGGGDGPTPTGDPSTGMLRGLVVDQAIVPVLGVTISLNTGQAVETAADGTWSIQGLAPGDYFVSASKAGYKGGQTSATVVGGVEEPDLVRLQVERIATAEPYLIPYKLDGYYQCAFSAGQEGDPFISDSCDFLYRTAWDGANATGNPPPVQRTPLKSVNTQFIDVTPDTFAIVQEAFWDDEKVPVMMVLLSSTPIDNDCDCSKTDYLDVTMPNPTYGRLDRYNATGEVKGFPVGERVAARGFLSWESTSTAQNLQFVVITTLFYNYVPPQGWTFQTRDTFPVG